MTQTTLTVKEATRERFNDLKDELAEVQPECPDHTADSFLNALMDTWEAADNGYYSECNPEAIAEHLEDALDLEKWGVTDSAGMANTDEIRDEIRKAQELAEQARDAAQAVEDVVEPEVNQR